MSCYLLDNLIDIFQCPHVSHKTEQIIAADIKYVTSVIWQENRIYRAFVSVWKRIVFSLINDSRYTVAIGFHSQSVVPNQYNDGIIIP